MNIIDKICDKLTKNKTKVPLFWVEFNYKKYQTDIHSKSCEVKIHPVLAGDEHIQNTLRGLIEYIRVAKDMSKLV